MLSLLLLGLTIIASMIVVRIGAIALELTGLPEDQASFEALSSYTGTGFTTSQSEYAIGSPQRKKVIITLMRLGSAGVITTIATLGGTLIATPDIMQTLFHQDQATMGVWAYAPLVLVITAIVVLGLVYSYLKRPALNRLVKEVISMLLLKGQFVQPVNYEEIWMNPHGNGFVQVTLAVGNPLVGKRLAELDLAGKRITVVSVERLNESVLAVDDNLSLQQGDLVNAFGPVVTIRKVFHVSESEVDEIKKISTLQDRDATLPVGTLAPVFALQNQAGETVRLDAFKGKHNVILYFYPKDKSFFCSRAMREFAEYKAQLDELETVVMAINPESIDSHRQFCSVTSQGAVEILSDQNKLVCKAYRTLMLSGLLVNRTVYIIDKEGLVRYAKRGGPPIGEILANIPCRTYADVLAEKEAAQEVSQVGVGRLSPA
ncbi:MAG: redoxin domain-containing protein [Cyanobacteria bacterium HKST-UBA04]|nr:redoxin domain-containing protein [Cyanobacteria bacterium HKST-UBA04]